MTAIPDDIMETAREVYLSLMDTDLYDDHKYGSEHIARAIMAERERCAMVAECAPKDRPLLGCDVWDDGYVHGCADAAAAIRKGAEL